jgi:hypothetical protein
MLLFLLLHALANAWSVPSSRKQLVSASILNVGALHLMVLLSFMLYSHCKHCGVDIVICWNVLSRVR